MEHFQLLKLLAVVIIAIVMWIITIIFKLRYKLEACIEYINLQREDAAEINFYIETNLNRRTEWLQTELQNMGVLPNSYSPAMLTSEEERLHLENANKRVEKLEELLKTIKG